MQMVVGNSGLLFLQQDNDGAYQTVESLNYMSSDTNDVFDIYYSENSEETFLREDLTISEIIDFIGDLTNSESTQPNFTLPPSLHAPLLIKT